MRRKSANKEKLQEIFEKFDIKDLEDLEARLEQQKFFSKRNMVCVDMESYSSMMHDLNAYLKIEKELGYDVIGFIKSFMKGDAFWAYEKEKRIIGEMKLENPFSHKIKVERITDDEPRPYKRDKKKLN